MSGASRCTPEQDAVLTRDWTAGVDVHAILARLQAIPMGRAFATIPQIYTRVRALKLQRPADWTRTAQLRVVAEGRGGWAAHHGPRGGRKGAQPIPVPLRELIRHGRELGLAVERAMDVDAVSRAMRRAVPGHPGFVLALAPHRTAMRV